MPTSPEATDMRAAAENFSQKFDELLDLLICKDASTYEKKYESFPTLDSLSGDTIGEINTFLNEGSFFLNPGKPTNGALTHEKFYMLAFLPYFKKYSPTDSKGSTLKSKEDSKRIFQQYLYFPAIYVTKTTKICVAKAVGDSYPFEENYGKWLDLDTEKYLPGYFSKLYSPGCFPEQSGEDVHDFDKFKEKIKKRIKAQLANIFLEFSASLEKFSLSLEGKPEKDLEFGEKGNKATFRSVSPAEYKRCFKEIQEFSEAFSAYILGQEPQPPVSATSAETISCSSALGAPLPITERQYYCRIVESMKDSHLILDEEGGFLKRFHIALQTRKFVILAGVSGTGKTRLALEYARAVRKVERELATAKGEAAVLGAPPLSRTAPDPRAQGQTEPASLAADYEHCHLEAVAPNWTSNDDFLGYHNPLKNNDFVPTPVWEFIKKAQKADSEARQNKKESPKFFLILDEMNLARVEHYFAAFLSAMELRSHGASESVFQEDSTFEFRVPDNLYFIGTVNIDETTHDFSDKVYDRAQLLEMPLDPALLSKYFERPEWGKYRSLSEGSLRNIPRVLMNIWQILRNVAPFGFRVLDDILAYLELSEKISPGQLTTALDVCVLQKILPKIRGGENIESVLDKLQNELARCSLKESAKKAEAMKKAAQEGYVTFFTCGS